VIPGVYGFCSAARPSISAIARMFFFKGLNLAPPIMRLAEKMIHITIIQRNLKNPHLVIVAIIKEVINTPKAEGIIRRSDLFDRICRVVSASSLCIA
jgi:hypothetical protein